MQPTQVLMFPLCLPVEAPRSRVTQRPLNVTASASCHSFHKHLLVITQCQPFIPSGGKVVTCSRKPGPVRSEDLQATYLVLFVSAQWCFLCREKWSRWSGILRPAGAKWTMTVYIYLFLWSSSSSDWGTWVLFQVPLVLTTVRNERWHRVTHECQDQTRALLGGLGPVFLPLCAPWTCFYPWHKGSLRLQLWSPLESLSEDGKSRLFCSHLLPSSNLGALQWGRMPGGKTELSDPFHFKHL